MVSGILTLWISQQIDLQKLMKTVLTHRIGLRYQFQVTGKQKDLIILYILIQHILGLEEKILGSKGTVEPEKGKYYFEETKPAAAFVRLINDIEHDMFDAVPFAGTSWEPESANENKGEYILGKSPKEDGTSLMLDAFIEAVITKKQPARVTEEAYYSSALSLLGHQALEEQRIVTFPDEYKLNYLNHVHKPANEEEKKEV